MGRVMRAAAILLAGSLGCRGRGGERPRLVRVLRCRMDVHRISERNIPPLSKNLKAPLLPTAHSDTQQFNNIPPSCVIMPAWQECMNLKPDNDKNFSRA